MAWFGRSRSVGRPLAESWIVRAVWSIASVISVYATFGGDPGAALRNGLALVMENTTAAVVLLVSLLFLGWSFRHDLRPRLGLGLSNEGWMRQIEEWTYRKRGWRLSGSSSDRKGFKVEFQIPIGRRGSQSLLAVRSDDGEFIHIGYIVEVTGEHVTQLANLSDDGRVDLRDDLVVALAPYMVEFDLSMDKGQLKEVTVVGNVPARVQTTEDEFRETVHRVVAAGITATIFIGRTARKVAATQDAAQGGGT